MIVFLNGRFVPEEQALVTVFDRSFLYGDGLFDVLRIFRGKPFRWTQHLERLERGALFLGIPMPFSHQELATHGAELISKNQVSEGLLRITLSRGVGLRGYSPRGAGSPFLVMSIHPGTPFDQEKPRSSRMITSSLRVPAGEGVANVKTCNQLYHVLARAEAEAAGADDALLLNTRDEFAEATSSNLFWTEDGTVWTTPLDSGALAGVTRSVLIELCARIEVPVCEAVCPRDHLYHTDGVFLSLSSSGITEVIELDRHVLARSELVQQLHQIYCRLLVTETR
jgi:branched-chain amino acid aminotransferase